MQAQHQPVAAALAATREASPLQHSPASDRQLSTEGKRPQASPKKVRDRKRRRKQARPDHTQLQAPIPPATKDAAANVTHVLTVQGLQLALAMLTGRKLVENRTFRVRPGWIALHLGVGKRVTQHGLQAAQMYPDLPRDADQPSHFGKIVGLLRISEHRVPRDCADHPWAIGPICNVISHALTLHTPIQWVGNLGCQPLTANESAQIRQQVLSDRTQITTCDVAALGPYSSRPSAPSQGHSIKRR